MFLYYTNVIEYMNHAFENTLEKWNNKSKQVSKKIEQNYKRFEV